MSAFGFTDYQISLSTKPEKYVGELSLWDHATSSLESALQSRGLDHDIDEGGGAFYGPKIDIKIKDALGREWQCSTVQFDFNLPERFDLTFQDSDGERRRPYMVHRAILGSLERFFGVLIEHYAGAFPLWLAPNQATIIPIADRHSDYCEIIREALSNSGFRVEIDNRGERMNQKIRQAQMQKVPYMLVIGDREQENQMISVRSRESGDLGSMNVKELISKMQSEAD